MLYIYYTEKRKDNDVLLSDAEIIPHIMDCYLTSIRVGKDIEINVSQVLYVYSVRSLIAEGSIDTAKIKVYINGTEHTINDRGRFITYPLVDLFEITIDKILQA